MDLISAWRRAKTRASAAQSNSVNTARGAATDESSALFGKSLRRSWRMTCRFPSPNTVAISKRMGHTNRGLSSGADATRRVFPAEIPHHRRWVFYLAATLGCLPRGPPGVLFPGA